MRMTESKTNLGAIWLFLGVIVVGGFDDSVLAIILSTQSPQNPALLVCQKC
jgi:hypothetical protein